MFLVCFALSLAWNSLNSCFHSETGSGGGSFSRRFLLGFKPWFELAYLFKNSRCISSRVGLSVCTIGWTVWSTNIDFARCLLAGSNFGFDFDFSENNFNNTTWKWLQDYVSLQLHIFSVKNWKTTFKMKNAHTSFNTWQNTILFIVIIKSGWRFSWIPLCRRHPDNIWTNTSLPWFRETFLIFNSVWNVFLGQMMKTYIAITNFVFLK